MKKLTKKLGMSTLALASVFAVGFAAVNSNNSTTTSVETYVANTEPSYADPMSVEDTYGTTFMSVYEISYSYTVETVSTSTNTNKVNFKMMGEVPSDVIHGTGANAYTNYQITLQETSAGVTDSAWETEGIVTANGDDSIAVVDGGITLDTTATNSSMTFIRDMLDTLVAGGEYTMKIYLSAGDSMGNDVAGTANGQLWATFSFKVPTTVSSVTGYGSTESADNVSTLNGKIWDISSTTDVNLRYYGNPVGTGPSDDSKTDALDSTFTLSNTYLPSDIATEESLDYSYKIEYKVDSEYSMGLTTLALDTTATAQEVTLDNGDVVYRPNLPVFSGFLLAENTTYNFVISVSSESDAGSDKTGTIDYTEWFSFNLSTPDGVDKISDETTNQDDFSIYATYDANPATDSVAITAIVLASIFGVTTIGLGAYIVVNNNKSKKASTPAAK